MKFIRLIQSVASKQQPNVRVRFAPSPTGHIHLGGLRTAFYNYIFARQHKGQFILRVEDTDQSRVIPGSADEIEHVLHWAGLEPDESPLRGGHFGPYIQSQRLSLYQRHAHNLLKSGHAYRCFCSQTRLELLRINQARNREKIRYDGKCRHLNPDEIDTKLRECDNKYVIRLKLLPGSETFRDIIFGAITTDLVQAQESDPILLKSDAYPTYHLANVVDDHEMQISHVLRGSEWLSSTPKHLQLYRALGWSSPQFAHFPLITMQDGLKMSKRTEASRVSSLIEAGYTPRVLFNFLTTSGGGVPKTKQDAMILWNLDDLVHQFDFKKVTCHGGSMDTNRLKIYSAKDLKERWLSDPDRLLRDFFQVLDSRGIVPDIEPGSAKRVIGQLIDRLTTLNDLLTQDMMHVWCRPQLNWSKDEYEVKIGWNLESLVQDLIDTIERANLELESKEKFSSLIKNFALERELHYATFMKVLRKLLTNSQSGLPIYEIYSCLGHDRFLDYLKSGLDYVRRASQTSGH